MKQHRINNLLSCCFVFFYYLLDIRNNSCSCCISYDTYFNNRIVCYVSYAIYFSKNPVQLQNCVCCASNGIHSSITKLCVLCILQYIYRLGVSSPF